MLGSLNTVCVLQPIQDVWNTVMFDDTDTWFPHTSFTTTTTRNKMKQRIQKQQHAACLDNISSEFAKKHKELAVGLIEYIS